MGKAIDKSIRLRIVQEHSLGKSCKELALAYNIGYKSVLRFCKAYKQGGEDGLNNSYKNCGTDELKFAHLIYRSACWLKYLHPNWGAAYILIQLEKRHGSTYELPNERTAQLWFKQKGYNKQRLKNKPSTFSVTKASFIHDIWQIDAKEKVKLGNDSLVCWLTITDEYSCAILEAPVFSPQANFAA